MKILGMNFGASKSEPIKEIYTGFSTPFGKIGEGNLSLPHIDPAYTQNQIVYFGQDNNYPAILTQMYYSSPIHSSIVNFKVNAVLGGGYELKKDATASTDDDLKLRTMNIIMRLKESTEQALFDLILHNRVYFKVHFYPDGEPYKFEYVSADKVRRNKEGNVYAINEDWSRGSFKTEHILPYTRKNAASKAECLLYCYEKNTVGQDIYPLPSYTSALNWCFLDGEMSWLQKEYIINGIFPSYSIAFPNKPATEDEKNELKKTIHGSRGAKGSGKIWTFFGRGKDSLPEIQVVPVSQLDNAFQSTTESIDSKICQSHTIDPILMGIRVSGKLGSGSDIKQAYIIFEKNIVMPLRNELESIFNDLLGIARVKGKLVVNEFEIVKENIVETKTDESRKVLDALNSMSPLVATKVLESMTQNERRALAALKARIGGDEIPKSQPETPTDI